GAPTGWGAAPREPMPTYEYACSACGNQWEEIQKITDSPVTVCPKCKKKKAQRQISGGNFILKGGGWYADLYSSPKPAGAKKEDAAGAKTGSKTEKKADAKGEASTSSSSSPTPSSTGSTAPAAKSPAKKD